MDWWSSTINVLKETGDNIIKDVGEFTNALTNENAELLEQIKRPLIKDENKTDDKNQSLNKDLKQPRINELTPHKLERRKQRLLELQQNVQTYTEDPSDMDEYLKFKEKFEKEYVSYWEQYTKQVLESQSIIKEKLKELTPETVPDVVFWCRYIFKIQQLDRDEQRRQKLISRINNANVEDEVPLDWDDEDEDVEHKEKENNDNTTEKHNKSRLDSTLEKETQDETIVLQNRHNNEMSQDNKQTNNVKSMDNSSDNVKYSDAKSDENSLANITIERVNLTEKTNTTTNGSESSESWELAEAESKSSNVNTEHELEENVDKEIVEKVKKNKDQELIDNIVVDDDNWDDWA